MRSIDGDRGRDDLHLSFLDRGRIARLEHDVGFWQSMVRFYEKREEWHREDLERERQLATKAWFPVWWQVISSIIAMFVVVVVILMVFGIAIGPLPGSRLANALAAFRGTRSALPMTVRCIRCYRRRRRSRNKAVNDLVALSIMENLPVAVFPAA